MSDEIKFRNKIEYIKQKTPDISLKDRQEILKMIIDSGVNDEVIQSKGNGTQIKFKDIPVEIIDKIYMFIQNKNNDKLHKLSQLAEDVTSDD